MNIQFVISHDQETIYVLEVNPRASRTVPIASKVTGVPMVDLATRVQMGESLAQQGFELGLHQEVPFYAVKMPVFSTNKLPGVDPILGPEMKSTGEAIGLGSTVANAMAKAFGWKEDSLKPLTNEDAIYLSMNEMDSKLAKLISELKSTVVADDKTAQLLKQHGIVTEKIVEVEEAQRICLEDGFELICSTNNSGDYDQHVKLREDALKSHTNCLTSKETLTYYLQATNQQLEEPTSISQYKIQSSNLNKKERVLR